MSISREETARIYAPVNAEKGCTIEDIEKLYNDALKMIDARPAAVYKARIQRGEPLL